MIAVYNEIPLQRPETPELDKINTPADLNGLDNDALQQIADQLRAYLLYSVGRTGGHFSAGLGVVELTVALHAVLDTPSDRLIWDVGHQAYPHKILTGRREAMATLRRSGGIAPFPAVSESDYDTLTTGHAGTSLSALTGLLIADQVNGHSGAHVAVVGDGALTCGSSYEALCHLSAIQAPALIILNDNAMSISPNRSTLATRLALYREAVDSQPNTLFTELGLHYAGCVDGHDMAELIAAIQAHRTPDMPTVLQVITRKGAGYTPAESDPVASHSLSKIQPVKQRKTAAAETPSASQHFGAWALQKARQDHRVQVITPAMIEGSGLRAMAEALPQQLHDVAIAEQHALTLAAGMALGGAKPVVSIYSTFLQRAMDQLIHDIAIENLDVTLAIDRAGLLEDGPTHSGAFDIALLRAVPNVSVLTPGTMEELQDLLDLAFDHNGPAAVRYPRGSLPEGLGHTPVVWGHGSLVREGDGVAVLVFGSLLEQALQAAETTNATVASMRFADPVDEALVQALAFSHHHLITLEEGVISGGAGEAVRRAAGSLAKVTQLGIPDRFPGFGPVADQAADCGLSTERLIAAIKAAAKEK